MSERVSTYTAPHIYPSLNAGILVHGYSAAVDWVKKDIAEQASPGGTLDPNSVSYSTLTSLRVRGYITDNDPDEEGRHVKEMLRVLATKQAAPFELIVSHHVRPAEAAGRGGGSDPLPIEKDIVVEGIRAILQALVPKINVRRLVRVTADLSQRGLSPSDIESLIYVTDRISADSKIAFEVYLRARDSYLDWLVDFRNRLVQARGVEVFADAQSVREEGYFLHIAKRLSNIFSRAPGHAKHHFSTRLRWTYEALADPEAEMAGMRENLRGLEKLGIIPVGLCAEDEALPAAPAEAPLVGAGEYGLLSQADKFFSAPSILSFKPFFTRAKTAISVGLDGLLSVSSLPNRSTDPTLLPVEGVVDLLKQEDQTPSLDFLSSEGEDLFCLRCPYCLICGGNPFLPEEERASYDCFKVFNQKMRTVLPALSRRKYEGE